MLPRGHEASEVKTHGKIPVVLSTPENKMGKSVFSTQEVLHGFCIIVSLKQAGFLHKADWGKFRVRLKEKVAHFGRVNQINKSAYESQAQSKKFEYLTKKTIVSEEFSKNT